MEQDGHNHVTHTRKKKKKKKVVWACKQLGSSGLCLCLKHSYIHEQLNIIQRKINAQSQIS